MTGLVRRTGLSIRLVRTSIEVTVLVVGWLLGGVVGLGTVLYAVAIGPIVQVFLPLLTVRARAPGPRDRPSATRPTQASRASANGSTAAAPAPAAARRPRR